MDCCVIASRGIGVGICPGRRAVEVVRNMAAAGPCKFDPARRTSVNVASRLSRSDRIEPKYAGNTRANLAGGSANPRVTLVFFERLGKGCCCVCVLGVVGKALGSHL